MPEPLIVNDPPPRAILIVSPLVELSVKVPVKVSAFPANVNALALLLMVKLLTDRLEMLLFRVEPDDPAEPNISESPLAGTALPLQLAAVPQFASVLPPHVSVFCAKAEWFRLNSSANTANNRGNEFFVDASFMSGFINIRDWGVDMALNELRARRLWLGLSGVFIIG